MKCEKEQQVKGEVLHKQQEEGPANRPKQQVMPAGKETEKGARSHA